MQTEFCLKQLRFLLISCLTVVCAFAVVACEADPPVVRQTAKNGVGELTRLQVSLSLQHVKMAEVIAALATQSGRNILVTDEPRHNVADLKFKGSLKDALDKTAAAYDYAWTLNKSGVLVMTKRFTRSEEYPQLLMSEFHQIARDNLAVLGAFNTNFYQDLGKLIVDMYAALKPDQREFLQADRSKTLTASQLSGEQKQQLESLIQFHMLAFHFYHYNQMLPNLETLLQATSASSLRITREERDPPAHSSATAEEQARFPYPRQWEMVQYMVVDKHGKTIPVWLYNRSFSARPVVPNAAVTAQEKHP